ncbi:MAG TPA: lysine--tRNA ligase [Planctomycetes bacterium]|nr:lysine--tRNA ligase [Planctomycetota bacterium]
MTKQIHPDRLKRVETLKERGISPFPARTPGEPTPIQEVLAGIEENEGKTYWVAGRLGQVRDFGKLRFSHLRDRSGSMQIGFQRDRLPEFWPNRKLLEVGDIIAVHGELGRTKKGEPTIWATEVVLLTKSLRLPPEKWHGLKDVETRYRMRYVDLFSNPEVRDSFVLRSRVIREIRAYFDELGYIEVETPILHSIPGGALARPFITHHNTLDIDLYLRIAPELYLKRLIVGGMERVYEIGRVFRNEGISTRHNPEFTMLESYEAYADYNTIMERVEGLFDRICRNVLGTHEITYREKTYNLKPPYPRKKYLDLFAEHNNGLSYFDEEGVRARAKELGVYKEGLIPEKVANDVFEATVEPHLDGPVFVIDYPKAICPLSKASDEDPKIAERFELFLGGMELGNAFSELNDPIDQEQRFEEQVRDKDPETPGEVDYDYVAALEYGMPPAGGLGIGIDRLLMVLSGNPSIRDVLLFPLLRPLPSGEEPALEAQEDEEEES